MTFCQDGGKLLSAFMKHTCNRIYPYVQNGRFYNYPNEIPEGFFFRSLYIYLKSHVNRLFYHPQTQDWIVKPNVPQRSIVPIITWIGHSTFLIQVAGFNIITDPIFGNATTLFPRILKPGLELAQLPPIDYVLISHNHLDHMDAPALFVFKNDHPQCSYLVPLGDKKWFDERGFSNVREYTWWQQDSFSLENEHVTFTFLPAFHWSQRGMFDKNRSLWGSWMIDVGGKRIYFAGDTAYTRHFKVIGQEFDRIDCALMPIGPCEPHKWMKFSHANAKESYQGFLDLRAHHFIPMHWGTFYFGTDTFETSLKELESVWNSLHQDRLSQKRLHIMHVGQTMPLPTSQPPELENDQLVAGSVDAA